MGIDHPPLGPLPSREGKRVVEKALRCRNALALEICSLINLKEYSMGKTNYQFGFVRIHAA
jgi:hypothetical protein